jgi:2-methylaconitate cis-trans-isomerase PrpF
MTNTSRDPDVNDPANEAVVRRIRRISIVSSIIMIAGVGTVLAVIVYRLMGAPGSGPAQSGRIEPLGRVVSSIAADGRLTVTYDQNGVPVIVVYDLKTLKETHRITVGGPQVPRP